MKQFALLLITSFISYASAAQSDTCAQHFAADATPQFINQKLAIRTVQLCYDHFSVMHSGISRTPIWSAQHLTAKQIRSSKNIKRNSSFHAEARLPRSDRAELRDYARSGFDRGHMAPAGDMPDRRSQYQSFSLANMVPQNANNNQILWAAIEEVTRRHASYRGELYVITGPIFEGSSLQRLNSRVLVPTYLYKAVYDPATGAAAAYVAPNAKNAEYQTVSIAVLEKRIGIRLFPSMTLEEKANKLRLPAPKLRSRNQNKTEKQNEEKKDSDGQHQAVSK